MSLKGHQTKATPVSSEHALTWLVLHLEFICNFIPHYHWLKFILVVEN